MRLLRWMSKYFREFGTLQAMLLVLAVLFIGAASIALSWGWLQSGPTQPESNSITLRNVGLLVGAVVALVFAVWRGRVSERQTDIAQQSLLNERYQKGAEMLGSPILPVRLGGIYALQRLAEEHPQEYHVQVMRLLCAFARNSTQYDEDDNQASVQAAMFAIGSRENTSVAIEENAKYTSNLSSINLHRMPLSGMNFSRVNLSRSNLNGTMLFRTNLSGSYLLEADLTNAKLAGADLSHAKLDYAIMSYANAGNANLAYASLYRTKLQNAYLAGSNFTDTAFDLTDLSGARFYENGVVAEGLTQRGIALAQANPQDPPQIDGILDPETGKPIDWGARPTIV